MKTDAPEMERNVLLIEDDGYCKFFLTQVLRLDHVRLTCAQKGFDAFESAADAALDAILINFQDWAEQELVSVRTLRKYNALTPIIAISERPDVDFALEVVHAGAFDCLSRPFNNAARVEKALRNAFVQIDALRKQVDHDQEEGVKYCMMGKSKLLAELQKTIRQIGPLQVNILVHGESGTGKELIARAIHTESERRSFPFVAVNCGAVPETLFESIFFGHEKGAFTGATRTHAGFLEKAHGGTLFLDEVGELTPKGQVALLRFLEDQEFFRVGGATTRKADVRIIAATNRNLDQVVEQQQFRADLYYRLNVVHLLAPSLRQRPEDILPLADHFLTRFCLKNRLNPIRLSSQAANLLEKYNWPGNVRELENLMEGLAATLPSMQNVITRKAIVEYSGKIASILPRKTDPEDASPADQTYKEAMDAFETRYFQLLLDKHNGNVAQAARHAGIHPVTLHRKLRRHKKEGSGERRSTAH